MVQGLILQLLTGNVIVLNSFAIVSHKIIRGILATIDEVF